MIPTTEELQAISALLAESRALQEGVANDCVCEVDAQLMSGAMTMLHRLTGALERLLSACEQHEATMRAIEEQRALRVEFLRQLRKTLDVISASMVSAQSAAIFVRLQKATSDVESDDSGESQGSGAV